MKSKGNAIHKMLSGSCPMLGQPRVGGIGTAVSMLPTLPGPLLTRQLLGRLLNQAPGAPLVGFTVMRSIWTRGLSPPDLGYDITNTKGLLDLAYITLRDIPLDTDEAEQVLQIHL
jgi:hypothetical protein